MGYTFQLFGVYIWKIHIIFAMDYRDKLKKENGRMGKFINPFTDWGFKRIFGQEVNKELLIDFLNELFAGEHVIRDIKFRDKEMLGETKDSKSIVFDIFCDTDDGKHIIVEMQNSSMKHYIERSIYYLARAVSEQGVVGDWDYSLSPVYIISFLNFNPNDRVLKKFRTDASLRDIGVEEPLTKKVRLIYLVLPYFDKDVEECENDFDCWIYLLKNMNTLERMPFIAQNAVFRKLAQITDITTLSKSEREKYDYSLKNMRDYIATYNLAEEKGIEKGFERGRAKGRAEGHAEGKAEGRAEGRAEGSLQTARENARKMRAKGFDQSLISEITGLSIEEIMGL